MDTNTLRAVVALCATALGVSCILQGIDSVVVATVAMVLGWCLGRKAPLPSGAPGSGRRRRIHVKGGLN